MQFFSPTRIPVAAGILALSLVLPGSILAKTKKHHTSRSSSTHSAHHHARAHETSYKHSRHHGKAARKRVAVLGQQVIDPQRTTEIQQALIQAHYMDGTPSGQWDASTQAAMQKYQSDNGWQSKIMPDSRALIKLGLGPKQDEGEYASATPTGVSNLSLPQASGAAQYPTQDAVRAVATSEMPTPIQN